MNGKEFSVYVSSDKIEKAFEECNGFGLKGKWLSGTLHPIDAVKIPGSGGAGGTSGIGGAAEMSMPSRDKSQDLILELNASKARAAVLLDMVNKLLDKISVKI